jgi:hypothetical protein
MALRRVEQQRVESLGDVTEVEARQVLDDACVNEVVNSTTTIAAA